MLYEVITGEIRLADLGMRLFDELAEVAELLDHAYGRVQYQTALEAERKKLQHPEHTLSAQLLDQLLTNNLDRITSYNVCYTKLLR